MAHFSSSFSSPVGGDLPDSGGGGNDLPTSNSKCVAIKNSIPSIYARGDDEVLMRILCIIGDSDCDIGGNNCLVSDGTGDGGGGGGECVAVDVAHASATDAFNGETVTLLEQSVDLSTVTDDTITLTLTYDGIWNNDEMTTDGVSTVGVYFNDHSIGTLEATFTDGAVHTYTRTFTGLPNPGTSFTLKLDQTSRAGETTEITFTTTNVQVHIDCQHTCEGPLTINTFGPGGTIDASVDTCPPVTIQFSCPIDPTTVNSDTITFETTQSGYLDTHTLEWSVLGSVVTIRVTNNAFGGSADGFNETATADNTVTVTTDVKSTTGEALDAPVSWTFTVTSGD